ncbi:lipopolysaccharide transport periplasmic protein LptA [Rhodanobacter hydrolyticus]|uniref:Lipopolysaccharide transport periplasmic protein LptA n=2 Tax=Rhodanobacter hydrolyticus TaxID=2250595 RepID=A0ABW8J4T2_9GAMM
MQAMAPSRRARVRNANREALGIACVAALLALAPLAASAKKSDRQQLMNTWSVKTDAYNAPNTVTTLTGSVRITQGTMLLTGDIAKIYLDGDQQVSRVVVTGTPGHPAHIQELDENNNLVTGDAATLDYDNVNNIAVLIGNAVVVQQCRGEFHGDKLTYNQNTNYITGDTASNGLVHGVILPKNTTGAPVICAKPPTAMPVPDNEPVAGKLPPKAVAAPAKPAAPAKGN